MFRDNLKEQIEYKGLIIKELAAKTGISKRTIDTYVDSRAVIPNAEIAFKLAQALDTTVEYLVTGRDDKSNKEIESKNLNKTMKELDSLTPEIQNSIVELIHNLYIQK